jgi:hypothetical protein
MSKAELITWLATLPEDSPDLDRVAEIRHGAEPEGDWLSLKEVAAKVRKHVVWLARLRVPEVCGERLAGRRSYKLSRVMDYLKSEDCRARIVELKEQRRAHESRKAGGV